MKHPVDRIVCTNHPNVADNSWRKVQILPGSAIVLGMIYYSNPGLLVYGDFDVVRINSKIKDKTYHTNKILRTLIAHRGVF